MDYEQGLEQLKQYLHGTAREQEFLVYQARLTENLDSERRYGTNDQIRSDRAHIIDQLNRLARHINPFLLARNSVPIPDTRCQDKHVKLRELNA